MIGRLFREIIGLIALATSAPVLAGTANVHLETTGAPSGFAELAAPRDALVDVYFGGRKVGEASAVERPGLLQFRSPREVAALVPQVIASDALVNVLSGELPTHSEAVCSSGNAGECGVVSPEVAEIIYDASRFRVDLFVNPRFLRTTEAVEKGYLPASDAPLGLTSSIGASIAGSTVAAMTYNLQSRTIVGIRNGRIRANASISSGVGAVVDDFVAELEDKDLRYSAGLFWAPGNDFIGQRRMIGAGVGTQFDTRIDRDTLHGTPIVVFLTQPARIEMLIEGRLVSSRSYSAGNNSIDTSALPDGSYTLLLRIHQTNGAVREERRFYVKSSDAPPVGHPVVYAFAGLLAGTRRHQPFAPSGTLYYQAGTAWRINNAFALDAAVLGTQRKGIVQAGAWLIGPQVRVRAAALLSTAGDSGALLQVISGSHGPLNFNFDIRRISSRDGKPLIPVSSFTDSFRTAAAPDLQSAQGSYTQATGSIGLRIGAGHVSVVASYRKDGSVRGDYSIGPSVSWPVVAGNGFQIVLDASAQRTRNTTAAFAGARLLLTSGGFSMLGTLGHASQRERDDRGAAESRVVGDITAQYSHEDARKTLVQLEAGASRDVASSTVRAGGSIASRFGNVRGDVLRRVDGHNGTQFGVTLQTGIAVSPHSATLGGHDLEPSALVVSIDGDAAGTEFDVLVDDVVRGRVRAGRSYSLFVPGYRTYAVRLVPTSATSVRFDSAARAVTVYPGNVQTLVWSAESYFTLFAQAISNAGRPIANAFVQTAKAVAETDPGGYFQIDVAPDELITIHKQDGSSCKVQLPLLVPKHDFASAGKVLCQ